MVAPLVVFRYLHQEEEENSTGNVAVSRKRSRVDSTPFEDEPPMEKAKMMAKKTANGDGKTKRSNSAKYNHFVESDLDHLPLSEHDGVQPEKENLLLLILPNGKPAGIKLFQDRPESFASPAARLQWEEITAKNTLKLKTKLESGEVKPKSIPNQVETEITLSEEEMTQLKKEKQLNFRKNQVSFLRTEAKLLELENGIKMALNYDSPDADHCCTLLEKMAELELHLLMLLKHPGVVETIKRSRRYVGNKAGWSLTPEQAEQFQPKAHRVRKRAQKCFSTFKSLLAVPEEQSFHMVFAELVSHFNSHTQDMTEMQLMQLVEMPQEITSKQNALMMSAIIKKTSVEEPSPTTEITKKPFSKTANSTSEKAANSAPDKVANNTEKSSKKDKPVA